MHFVDILTDLLLSMNPFDSLLDQAYFFGSYAAIVHVDSFRYIPGPNSRSQNCASCDSIKNDVESVDTAAGAAQVDKMHMP